MLTNYIVWLFFIASLPTDESNIGKETRGGLQELPDNVDPTTKSDMKVIDQIVPSLSSNLVTHDSSNLTQHYTNPSFHFPSPPIVPITLTSSTFSPPPIPSPETVIRIAHAYASTASDYVKKPNVFRLHIKEGAEFLFEVR